MSKEKYIRKMLHNAEIRAYEKNIPFDIDENDIIIPDVCPILGTPLSYGDHKRWEHPENTISIDRVIPEKGYVKGNVRIISMLANTMKNKATPEQLKNFSENIMKYINGEDIVQTAENNESAELQDKEPVR